MRFLIVLTGLVTLLAAFTRTPEYRLEASGLVTDLAYEKGRLYAATGAGVVDRFDLSAKKRTGAIRVPDIKDFMGDTIPAKIYSVDVWEGRVLIVAQGAKGYRELYLSNGKDAEKKIGVDEHLFIKKASFVDDEKVLIGLLSNELILYSLKENRALYRKQIRPSTFSDFALSEDKTRAVVADESGILTLIDVATGDVVRIMEGENLDNVYQVDYKNGIAAGAGQDRKVSIYRPKDAYHVMGKFLIYSVGLSPKAAWCAYAYNEASEIALLDVASGSVKGYYTEGHHATLSRILFTEEQGFFSAADEKSIYFWRVP